MTDLAFLSQKLTGTWPRSRHKYTYMLPSATQVAQLCLNADSFCNCIIAENLFLLTS